MPDPSGGEPAAQPQGPGRPNDSVADSWGEPTGQESGLDERPAYYGDRVFYRRVLNYLGVIALASVAAAIYFPAVCKDIPEALIALGSAAVGALASLVSVQGRQ